LAYKTGDGWRTASLRSRVVIVEISRGGHEMNMADAAEQVLRSSGRDLSPKEIASQAVADGLISPRSDKPWVYITAAIRKDNRRRQDQGQAVRFASAGTGRYKLSA
jgi:hypothetical protein